MLVLGVGGFMHDYSACLIDLEKNAIAMCEAERLSRKKHHVIRGEDDLLPPIERFDDLTGVPIVLNTSFNDKGEPIVETPADAVDTFLKTEMDVLCMGDVVAWKT